MHPLTTLSFNVLGNHRRQLTVLPRLHQGMRVPSKSFLETSFLDSAFPSPTELVGFFVCLFFFLLLPSCNILLRIFPLKPCSPPRSDCAKVAPAPCLFPCVPGARSADFSHKIKLSQPLPPISPASLPQEERTGFSLLCISRIIHQLGFVLTAGGLWDLVRKPAWLAASVGSLHGEPLQAFSFPCVWRSLDATPLGQREVAGCRGFRARFFPSLYTS